MRNLIVKRITAGLTAAMLMLTNVLLPVQPVFATEGIGEATVVADQAEIVEEVVGQPESAIEDEELTDSLPGSSKKSENKESKTDNEGTYQPVWCQYTNVWTAQIGDTGNDNNKNRFPLTEIPSDASSDLKTQINPDTGLLQVYAPNSNDQVLKGELDAYCATQYEFEMVSIPANLASEDPCGLDNAYLITTALGAIENISYVVNGDRSVMVTDDEGYRLIIDGELTPDYKNYTYLAPKDSNKLCKALSEEPKFVDPCGTTKDYFVVEKTKYVEYYNGDELLKAGKRYHVTDASEVTITAKVTNEDYEIVNDAVYTHQFTDEPCVELDAKAWCDDLDTKIKVVLTNTTNKRQKLEVVISSGDDEVYSEVVRLKKNETETLYTKIAGDGEFTVSIYAMKGKKRGELLTQKIVESVCVDTFTPEIYKKNQDGAILSTGTFDVEVCQSYSEFDRMVMGEEQDGCITYEDVMFGTDGSWFANNVDYERNVPTTVTITETEAPVGCKMSTTPWVFTWNYSDVQIMSYHHMSGSWDTEDGANVFNLYNDCDKPGQGEYTPDPVTPVVPVEVETLADTGESENAILAVAAGMLLASVGLALSPRLYRGEA